MEKILAPDPFLKGGFSSAKPTDTSAKSLRFIQKNYNTKTKVLATGGFDYLHEGHLNFLKQAKAEGDYLVVIVATDKSIKEIKGLSPENSQDQRAEALVKTGIPDKVLVGDPHDKLKKVLEEKPDLICLGYDQKIDEKKLQNLLEERGLKTKIKRLKAFNPEKYKSSILQRKKQIEQKDIL